MMIWGCLSGICQKTIERVRESMWEISEWHELRDCGCKRTMDTLRF